MALASGNAYISKLAESGRYQFTTEEARSALGTSVPAVQAVLRRLKQGRRIADPHRGFHVILTPEYRRLGCPPPEHFLPELMEHLGERHYYAALLSAAEMHGAAHHRPQAFQVMLAKNRRGISCGAVRVQFIARRDVAETPIAERNTPRGAIRVASPEATALELVGYAHRSGGLDNVASVLGDLAAALDRVKLVKEAHRSPVVWVQRLGYLLDLLDQRGLADALTAQVHARASVVAPLVRNRPITRVPRAERWKLAVNATVEPDL